MANPLDNANLAADVDHSIDAAAQYFDKIYKTTPENVKARGEDGKFASMKAPDPVGDGTKAPPTVEPHLTPEGVPAPEGEQEAGEQSAEAEERFQIQLDGEEVVEMSAEEIREAVKLARMPKGEDPEYVRQRDERIRALDNERFQLNQERQNALRAVGQWINQAQQQLQQQFPDIKNMADLSALAQNDPARYVQWQHAQNQISAAANEARQLQERQRTEYEKQREQVISQEAQKLAKADPVFADPAKAKAELGAIKEHLLKAGYAADELDQLTDHRTVLQARKAMLYDRLMAAKPERKLVAPTVRTILRPGAATARTPAPSSPGSQLGKAKAQFNKSGSVQDLAKVFAAQGVR